LAAQRRTYAGSSTQRQTYPIEISPGNTATLNVLFRLDDDVRKTFHQAAELRVHYRNGNQQEIARANILGGSLENSH
jgi:hypothetical protein